MKNLLSFAAVLALGISLGAADIYVDYNNGNRKNPGTKAAPLDIFARALNKAKPGDTIYILPSDKPIRDAIVFRGKSGEPGQPITVDGMNNIFLGTLPLKETEWKEFQPGYFKCVRKIGTNMSNRYFMTLGGKIHRMGRFNKAKGSSKFKKLEELCEFQIQGGTDGIVVLGTTGESSTMSHEEDEDVGADSEEEETEAPVRLIRASELSELKKAPLR